MVTEITMPKLGMAMKKGAVGKWHKKEGERVQKGEVLFEVETEKITKKIESPASGVLRRIIVAEKQVVPVSAPLAFIGEPDESLPDVAQAPAATPLQTATKAAPEARPVAAPTMEIPEEVKISPLARKLAQEHGVDVARIQGTGPGGRIVKEDVLKAVEEGKAAPAPVAERVQIKTMSTLRKVLAERLSQCHLTVVHVTITTEVDVTEMAKLRQTILSEIEKTAGVRISYNDIMVKAVAKALKEYPALNATLDGDNIKIFEDVHMGVAVAVEEGLLVLVLRDADKKSLVEISEAVKDLADRARKGTSELDEVSGSTFTITNLGMFGAEIFTPIVNPPESAILGIGRIVEKPAVVGEQIVVRSMMNLSLSFDHRIIDGAPATKFLSRVKQILENPYLLLT